MIEKEPKPVTEVLDAEVEVEPIEEPRAKPPWKAFVLTGFLAGLIGTAGGGYGAYAALKKFSPAPVAQAKVDLSPIEMNLKRLTDRVNVAEADMKDVANRPATTVEPVDLSALKARLAALEAAPTPEIDPEALTALQAAQKDGFEWPETEQIEAGLTQLDERLTKLEIADQKALDESSTGLTNEQARASLQDLHERVAMLEVNPDELQSLTKRLETLENSPAPNPVVERVSILAFPKTQMIGAVEANMEGGMIKKTLSRHIRVKDANDPLTLIDGIENDLSEGRLAAAAEKFERLPSPVRSAGQAWYESVKASL